MRLGYTQAKMAEILMMDSRSYFELDTGHNSCSALTFSLFLIYCCENPLEFLKELKCGYEEKAYNDFAQESATYRQKLAVKELTLYESDDSIYALCPRCNGIIDREYMKFCYHCGQKLSWMNWEKSPIINI